MSGLEFLRAIMEKRLPRPPMAELLGFYIAEVSEGRVVFACEPAEWHYNPVGSIHGGLAATLFDSSTSCAVHTTLPPGVGQTTAQLDYHLVRPMKAGMGLVRCIGTVVHPGKRMATAEARLVDAQDNLLGHAVATLAILR